MFYLGVPMDLSTREGQLLYARLNYDWNGECECPAIDPHDQSLDEKTEANLKLIQATE